MSLSKIFNTSGIARQCRIEKHKMMLFKNGVTKSLTPDQIDAVADLIKTQSEKTIKYLKSIKKENEKNDQ